MLKKTITYKNYNGDELTEDFYFNLSKSELAEMEYMEQGGIVNKIKQIVAAKNTPEIYKIFKEIILKAYGIKSDDGKRFMKSEEISKAFEETEAYSELVIELLSNEEVAAKFFEEIANIKEIKKQVAEKNKDQQ